MHSLGQALPLTTSIIMGRIVTRNLAVNLAPYMENITYVSLKIIFLKASV
jgi:hypothetical protein